MLHLKRLMDELVRRTDALGRSEWAEEECRRFEDVRYSPPDEPEKAFISIKGGSGLDGRGLAILRELAVFRESAALKLGRPTFRVMPDQALAAIAQDPNTDLKSISGIGQFGVRRYGKAIAKAVAKGMASDPVDRRSFRKPSPPRPSHEQMANLKQLKVWRSAQAKELSLDQSLIWPRRQPGQACSQPLNTRRRNARPRGAAMAGLRIRRILAPRQQTPPPHRLTQSPSLPFPTAPSPSSCLGRNPSQGGMGPLILSQIR